MLKSIHGRVEEELQHLCGMQWWCNVIAQAPRWPAWYLREIHTTVHCAQKSICSGYSSVPRPVVLAGDAPEICEVAFGWVGAFVYGHLIP